MANVVYIPDQEKVHNEAGDWIAKFDSGLSVAEQAEFQRWVCESQMHYDVFMSMAQVWDGMDDLSRLSDLFPEETLDSKSHLFKPVAVAASLLLAAVVGAFFVINGGKLNQDIELVNRYETSIGEHSTVNLTDGSKLVLNTNTLVLVDYIDEYRLITLERGEINIDVAHDEERPLSVKAGDRVVQAVGTAFNIELYDNNRFELIVTDGKVRVDDRTHFETLLEQQRLAQVNATRLESRNKRGPGAKADETTVFVSQGEKMVVGEDVAQPSKIEEQEIAVNLSWREGNLVFDGQPLGEAIKEIERYTAIEFQFEHEDIKDVRIAGLFKAGDVSGLLIALDTTFDISSKKVNKETISLFRKF